MPKNEKRSRPNINRRSFLKGIAATGAIATIAAAHPEAAAQSAKENKTPAKSWRDKPDPIDERLISDGGSYDVVVVGSGNAGVICARAAAMKGASVAVIEDQAEKGYIPGMGCQCGTINSKYALDRGAPRTDEGDFLRELARRNVIRHNPKRASYFVKNSGRIFDWLLSIADKEWVAENCHAMSCPPKSTVLREVSGWKFYYGSVAFQCHNEPFNKSWSGLLRMHHEKAMADGAKWFFEHHAEICDVDGSGAVTGVVAKRADGRSIRFKARKGVALCAGGFAGNPEMVIDILDTVRHEAEARGEDLNLLVKNASRGMGYARDGSSIKLGIWAGGHIEIGPRSTMGQGDPATGPWFVQLNRNGERFCDEAAGTALSQPDSIALVTLYDANWKKILDMMPPRHGAPDTGDAGEMLKRLTHLDNIKPGPPSKDQQPMGGGYYGLPGVSGTTCCANTIEELLDYMDCYKGEARKKALAEIKRYNEMCEKGIDEDFGKDPRIMKVTALKDPLFYGSVSGGGGLGAGGIGSGGMGGGLNAGMVTTTGLDTDAEGRVLNSDFEPIKGLYAAGNNAGGRFIVVYQSPIAGISLGMAITEGYMLGEMLADL